MRDPPYDAPSEYEGRTDAATHCPVCVNTQTERQMIEQYSDIIEDVRTCENCHSQWVVAYSDPIIREVHLDPTPETATEADQ